MAVSFIGEGKQTTHRKPQDTDKITQNAVLEYTLSCAGFKLTTLVVIGTDCTGSCKSIFHTITATAATGFFLKQNCLLYIDVLMFVLLLFVKKFHNAM